MEHNCLCITVPCYKEEEVLPETAKRLKAKMTELIEKGKISDQSRVVFINDGVYGSYLGDHLSAARGRQAVLGDQSVSQQRTSERASGRAHDG